MKPYSDNDMRASTVHGHKNVQQCTWILCAVWFASFCLQLLRNVQKSLSQEADVSTPQRRLPSRMSMRVFQRGFCRSRLLTSKNTGLVKRTERTQRCCQRRYHRDVGQYGTTIMMDTRSVNTLFSTCAINGHVGLAYRCHSRLQSTEKAFASHLGAK